MNARLLGALLVIIAFVLLVTGPEGFDALHVAGFIGCFVFGMLLVSGIIGRSTRVRALQAKPRADAAPRARVPVTAAREFRYRRPGVVARIAFTLMSLLWVGAACLVFAQQDLGVGERLGIGIGLLALAALAWVYWFAHYRQAVSVDRQGIRGRGYLRTIALRWDEIVALESLTVKNVYVGPIGSVYRVYGRDRAVRFFDSVQHADELLAIVREASGLDWNG